MAPGRVRCYFRQRVSGVKDKLSAADAPTLERAERYFREALAIRERYYDSKNDRIAQTLTNLAFLLVDRASLLRAQLHHHAKEYTMGSKQ